MFHPADITFDEKACASFTAMKGQEPLMKVTLHVPGMHNVSNALAAIALADDLGLSTDAVAKGIIRLRRCRPAFPVQGLWTASPSSTTMRITRRRSARR